MHFTGNYHTTCTLLEISQPEVPHLHSAKEPWKPFGWAPLPTEALPHPVSTSRGPFYHLGQRLKLLIWIPQLLKKDNVVLTMIKQTRQHFFHFVCHTPQWHDDTKLTSKGGHTIPVRYDEAFWLSWGHTEKALLITVYSPRWGNRTPLRPFRVKCSSWWLDRGQCLVARMTIWCKLRWRCQVSSLKAQPGVNNTSNGNLCANYSKHRWTQMKL